MRALARRGIPWLAMGCSLVLAVGGGCRRGPERAVVAGTVTYRGQAVADGAITFLPRQGTEAPTTIVAIADGKYMVDSLGGLPIGAYSVQIVGFRNRSKSRPKEAEIGQPLPEPEDDQQYIPAKHNVKSELKTTIEPSRRPLVRDFALID
jgi:hypothetical protein